MITVFIKIDIKNIIYKKSVSYTHLDVYKRQVLLSRREDSERLKNLSTALSYKVEAKGKDRDEIALSLIHI